MESTPSSTSNGLLEGVRILIEYPPIYERAKEIFGPLVSRAIFSYGDIIYNPSGCNISPWLMDHELVHLKRQSIVSGGLTSWWNRYFEDPKFRLDEEIPAHQAEYKSFCSQLGITRNERRQYLRIVASRLSGPLYGKIIHYDNAIKLIKMSLQKQDNGVL